MSDIKYNRAAARMRMREILPSVPGDLLDHALFKALDAAQVDAAIAAKDARIAELEGLLREMDSGWDLPPYFQHCIEQLLRDSSRFTWDLQNPESLRTRIDDALSAQQQADPTMAKNANVAATHSEDGREMPEVVGYLLSKGNQLSRMPAGDNDFPLMTVAQHERIVTGLQAELETERQHAHDQHSAWTVCDAERQQLRALLGKEGE